MTCFAVRRIRDVVGFEGGQLSVLDPSEGEDDVSAQERVNVFRQIFSDLGPE